MDCDLHQLAAFLAGELDPDAGAAIEAHLDGCALCMETFELHAHAMGFPSTGPAVLARGTSVGRYLVIGVLGRGAMGVVYTAYDPELDRRIALKLVEHPSSPGRESKARSTREARALARLAHPNVVSVFDVGEIDERLFIAMEHVHGASLGEWLHAEKRTQLEILGIFYQAGAGLAAAHAAGLVHRDFKPANVLVGDDGRARVVDFGLVRIELASANAAHVTPHDLKLLASTLAGTPAYMAPEQRHGVADARSDQYSFCVALAEALSGERPDADGTLRGDAVPSWIARILRRGLSSAPSQRYASMAELLAALETNPSVRFRRRVLIGVAATLAILGVVSARSFVVQRSAQCSGGDTRLESVWSAKQRHAVEAHLRALPVPYAADGATSALNALDAWSTRWRSAFRDACEATHVRHEQSQAELDLRMTCMTSALRDFSTTASVLSSLEGSSASHVVSVTDALPMLSACADTTSLGQKQLLPTSEKSRAEIERIESELTRARIRSRAGQMAAAAKELTVLVEAARATGYQPLVSDALATLGDAQDDLGDAKAAEASMFAAIVAAEEGRDDRGAIGAQAALARVLVGAARQNEALRFVELAESRLRRIGNDVLVTALVDDVHGYVLETLGRFEEARKMGERVLQLREESLGPTDHEVGAALVNLAVYDLDLQDRNGALEMDKRAVALFESTVGPEHPDYAHALANAGGVLGQLERYGEARDSLERALAIEVRLGMGDEPRLAIIRLQLGRILRHIKQLDRALEEDREALRITEHTRGPQDPWIGWPLVEIGLVELEQHHFAEARVALERALTMPPRKRPTKPEVKWPLAQAVWGTDGKKSRARVLTLVDESIASYDPKLGPEHALIDEMTAWKRTHLGAP